MLTHGTNSCSEPGYLLRVCVASVILEYEERPGYSESVQVSSGCGQSCRYSKNKPLAWQSRHPLTGMHSNSIVTPSARAIRGQLLSLSQKSKS